MSEVQPPRPLEGAAPSEEEVRAKPFPAKASYIGAPACFVLDEACSELNRAFDGQCYVVGSALERPNWRDVDVRLIMDDEAFAALFPKAGPLSWEFDPRWRFLSIAISERLAKLTGLPIDFQFQRRSHANKRHHGLRHPAGIIMGKFEGASEA